MSPINPLLVGLLRSFRNFTCRVRWLLFVAIRAMHAFLITSSTCELHFLYIESDISSHESVHNQPINSKRITLNTINPLPRKEKRRRRRLIARTLSLSLSLDSQTAKRREEEEISEALRKKVGRVYLRMNLAFFFERKSTSKSVYRG